MTKRYSKPAPGEVEAMLLSLMCFAADLTSAQFDRMSAPARERVRAALGLTVHQFHDACEYLAAYQSEFSYGLRELRESDKPIVLDEPGAARLQ